MICSVCQKDLPESEFYQSHIKRHWYICKKCKSQKNKEQSLKNILTEDKLNDFDRYYGGIKINITNYPQAYEIVETSGEYYFTRSKEEFIKKLLDILK